MEHTCSCEKHANAYSQLAGKIGTSSVFVAAAILIFGGSSGSVIVAIALLVSLGIVFGLLQHFKQGCSGGCCAGCTCGKDEKPAKKSSKKKK